MGRNRFIIAQLKEELQYMDKPLNKKHLERTCEAAKHEWYNRKRKERLKFSIFLKLQIRFLGWKVWLTQNLYLIIIYALFENMNDNFLVGNNRYAAVYLCCVSVLLLLTALPFMYRSTKYKMQEIEMCSFFSSAKLLLANLLIIFVGNLFTIGIVFWIATVKTSLEIGSIILYLGFPYLIISSRFIYLLGHNSTKRFLSKSIRFMVIAAMLIVTMDHFYKKIFLQSFSLIWAIICVGLIFYMIYQIRYILFQSSYVSTYFAEG